MLAYRAATGFTDAAGGVHKIGAYVALESGDWDELLQALHVRERRDRDPGAAVRDEPVPDGEPWTVVEGSPIVGGHYIPAVARPAEDTVTIVTWGADQQMTTAFYKSTPTRRGHTSPRRISSSGATLDGFDLAELQEDLNAL